MLLLVQYRSLSTIRKQMPRYVWEGNSIFEPRLSADNTISYATCHNTATDRESSNRFGVDASLNYRQLNLSLLWLAAHDSGALWGVGDDVDYNGGFAEVNFLPSTNFVGFARYDWVDTPDILGEDISRWTVGGRYYFADNLALHLEYSHRTQLLPGPNAEEDFATARLDFAF